MDSADVVRLLRAILNGQSWDEFIAIAPSFDMPEYREAWEEIALDVESMRDRGVFPDTPTP